MMTVVDQVIPAGGSQQRAVDGSTGIFGFLAPLTLGSGRTGSVSPIRTADTAPDANVSAPRTTLPDMHLPLT